MAAQILKKVKERLDKCVTKADYEALSDYLERLIRDAEVAGSPKLAAEHLKDQRKTEAQILVNRMRARVNSLREGKKSGQFDDRSSDFRRGLAKAEEDLSFAEEQLSKLA